MKWALLLTLAISTLAQAAEITVLDSKTKKPIQNAVITSMVGPIKTNQNGKAEIPSGINKVGIRAIGYARTDAEVTIKGATVNLTPFRPKGLYLSFYGIGSPKLRGDAVHLIETTELNALVIDIKGDRGMIPYPSNIPETYGTGKDKVITVKDMPAMINDLHSKGIYLIARIVTFKDDRLANAHPEWAVKRNGAIWHDREKLAWVDPSIEATWKYNYDIAEEAAKMGFDEIQFDYVRFPDTPGLVFSKQNNIKNRTASITGFWEGAKKRLAPYNVFVAADIFGYVCWNEDDTGIGQDIHDSVRVLDVVSPMLYPSGYTWSIPGVKNPVANSDAIIGRSLGKAMERTKSDGLVFRPWLQSFKDYAFDRRDFTGKEIREQIDAAEAKNSNGWMLWNARNQYSAAGLKPQ